MVHSLRLLFDVSTYTVSYLEKQRILPSSFTFSIPAIIEIVFPLSKTVVGVLPFSRQVVVVCLFDNAGGRTVYIT